jgi:type II secretory ATPase GspE/PulE/Tfp pilus assembly ATPase PilB-like protein
LHTNDAIGAIARLMDIGVSPKILSGNIIAIIAQRLARKLCKHCKREKVASEEECRIFGVDPSDPPTIYEKVGCEKCDHTGYKGRIAISEMIAINEEIDDIIYREGSKSELYDAARRTEFKAMPEDGILKVKKWNNRL